MIALGEANRYLPFLLLTIPGLSLPCPPRVSFRLYIGYFLPLFMPRGPFFTVKHVSLGFFPFNLFKFSKMDFEIFRIERGKKKGERDHDGNKRELKPVCDVFLLTLHTTSLLILYG